MRLVARQDHAGQPPAVWPAVAARRLWALRSARCRVTDGPAARCVSTRSRSMRARMCARRLTRPSSMTMTSASVRASGFLLWSFPRRLALLPCRHVDWLGHAAAVTLRSPRRLRRSPEDAPLRPAGALVNRTSPADGRITDPRVSNCWGPMRSARSGNTRREDRAAGAGPGAPRLPAGHATARTALPGTPGALDVPPRGRPDTNAGLRAAVRARAPRLSRRIPARRCRRTAGGTRGPESSGLRVGVGARARFRSLRRSVRRVVSLDGLRLRITDPRVSKCRLAVVGEGCLRPLVNYRPAGQ